MTNVSADWRGAAAHLTLAKMNRFGLHLLCCTLLACGSSGSQGPSSGSATTTPTGSSVPAEPAEPTEPAEPAKPAEVAEPAAPPADANPDALDLTQLGTLSDADLMTFKLEISYSAAPTPAAEHATYVIDAEHFGKRVRNKPEVARKTAGSLREIVNAIGRHEIAAQPEVVNDGCVGGATYTLAAAAAGKSVKLRWYRCAGKVFGTMAGDIEALVADIEWLLPDARRKLPRPAK